MEYVKEKIVVVHCGTRNINETVSSVQRQGVHIEIVPKEIDIAILRQYASEGSLKGIIISGMILGSPSIYEVPVIQPDFTILELGVPVLGVCYGHQYIAYAMGGRVEKASESEIGLKKLYVHDEGKLLCGVDSEVMVKLKHSDIVTDLPKEFNLLASTDISPNAAYECNELGLYGTQFHPEKEETQGGETIMQNFLFKIAGCTDPYNEAFLEISGHL
jgi:GMP synthase (glutamine-hydrolysing)